jgi:hypothetical protein
MASVFGRGEPSFAGGNQMKRIGTLVRWSKDYHFGQHNVGKVGIIVSFTYDIGYKIWWSDGQTSGGFYEHHFNTPNGPLEVVK